MRTPRPAITVTLVLAAFAGLLVVLSRGREFAILDPKGPIAAQERTLILEATGLMLLVVIPVFILTYAIVSKYREENTKATYEPNWDHHSGLEFIWWALPCLIIAAVSALSWKSSHDLDPFKPLNSSVKPMTIQVVALPWKWLFIYPEQGIATVNQVEFPAGTPVTFEITSDAPMNSFWIPQLGGQIYAMPGMSTQLHLQADQPGTYLGASANISGAGFAGMRFTATSTSQADFATWVGSMKQSGPSLSISAYDSLSTPSQNVAPSAYSSTVPGLYEEVVMKYMMPGMDLGTKVTPQ